MSVKRRRSAETPQTHVALELFDIRVRVGMLHQMLLSEERLATLLAVVVVPSLMLVHVLVVAHGIHVRLATKFAHVWFFTRVVHHVHF